MCKNAKTKKKYVVPCYLWLLVSCLFVIVHVQSVIELFGKQVTWDNILFFVFAFLHIFQNFPCTLGEKRKNVSFYRRVCMCKGKLTFVSFFSSFFCTFPLNGLFATNYYNSSKQNTVSHFLD